MYTYFKVFFQLLEIIGKTFFLMKNENKKLVQKMIWATAHLYCKEGSCIVTEAVRLGLYCRIVLQETWLGTICIAIHSSVL